MDFEFWVYIVASPSGTLYVGMTGKGEVRVAQHKSGEFEGFTKKYGCVRLVYYEKFDNVHKAIRREKELKGWRRSKKIVLIEKVIHAGKTWPRSVGGKCSFPGKRWRGRTESREFPEAAS